MAEETMHDDDLKEEGPAGIAREKGTQAVRRAKWLALFVLLLLQVIDFMSTRQALTRPGVVELNPWVRANGLWDVKLYAFCLVCLLVWYGKGRTWHLWVLCGAYGLIVGSNLILGGLRP
jgi:hypothetical protein